MRHCAYTYLGRIGYSEGLALQERCARSVKEGEGCERFLLLEHPPVITLGRNAHDPDVLFEAEPLRSRGIEVHKTNRGGQVTYHGPGQLIGYPILSLHPDRRDVARYLRDLEEVLMRALAAFGIDAGRRPGLTGVWVGREKIAAIGVHLSRWVTTHGFALNVTTDLSHFDLIVPCGIRGLGVTSMERILDRRPSLGEVAEVLVPGFGAVFEREMVPMGTPAEAVGVGRAP